MAIPVSAAVAAARGCWLADTHAHTAELAEDLARDVEAASVVAVDFSEACIQRMQKLRKHPAVECECGRVKQTLARGFQAAG